MNAVTHKEKNRNVAATEPQPTPRRLFEAPEVNIYEMEDEFVLEAEMPGVRKDQLEVSLERNTLTIVGRRTVEAAPGTPLYRESRDTDFRRVFEVDPGVDMGKVRAQMSEGVLTLELPKAEAVKPRTIKVE